MYKRFLNDSDYLSVITQKALDDITRGDKQRFYQAESDAEIAIVEYLSENYEIEAELNKGKYIAEYDRKITFPVGVYIYLDGKIHRVMRSISGFKAPSGVKYWEEYIDINADEESIPTYSQFATYYVNDKVKYNGNYYICKLDHGFEMNDVRMPSVNGWKLKEYTNWLPIEYDQWKVVKFNEDFYTLLTLEGFNNNVDPFSSECWGMIADYDPTHNDYKTELNEYVVYQGEVFYPEMNVNADIPVVGVNCTPDDCRNPNIKKHMVRLSVYELSKLIAPNNVSVIRVADYEASMKWLNDASKLKINPQIPRKIDVEENAPVSEWHLATYQTSFDPYKNAWII